VANPQLEEGHLRIANDIWDALCRIRIPGEVRQVIDTVLRKTWGFRKKQDWISLSQFYEATGIHKPNISRALTRAITMNIVLKKEKAVLNNENVPAVSYSFNKDYETWKPFSKKRTFSKKRKVVLNNEKKSSQKRGTQHTTDILKDIINVEKDKIPYSEIISDLNEVLGSHYKDKTEETRKGIRRWWKQGFSVNDFKKVHRIKYEQWKDDPKMSTFLRPSTLYGPKFEDYLNQTQAPEEDSSNGLPPMRR